ncbi:MAG: lipopolysaccharide biosynthesis protein [Deferrisomatales bacterium]
MTHASGKKNISAPAEPARPLGLRRNFAWTFAGNLVYALCQWGMLVVLAKMGSTAMVGQFALGLAVAAPVMLFSGLQLRGVQATDARGEYDFGDYLGLRLMTTGLGLGVVAAVAWWASPDGATALVILAVGGAKAVEAVSDVVHGLLQQRERMDRIAASLAVKGIASLAALGVAVALTRSAAWGAVAMAATWAAVLVLIDLPNARWALGGRAPRPRLDPATAWRLTKLALPLGAVMGLLSLNTNLPRYFIQAHLGPADLGVFAALAYLMVAGNLVVGALGQSASPRLAQCYARGDARAYTGLLGRLTGLGAALGIAGLILVAVAGRPLLTLLYTPEYADHVGVLLWLTAAAAAVSFAASFLGYGMTAARRFRAQVPLFCAVSAVTAAAAAGLVPRFGLTGAAWAVLAGALVQFAGSAWINARAVADLRAPGVAP